MAILRSRNLERVALVGLVLILGWAAACSGSKSSPSPDAQTAKWCDDYNSTGGDSAANTKALVDDAPASIKDSVKLMVNSDTKAQTGDLSKAIADVQAFVTLHCEQATTKFSEVGSAVS